LDLFEIEEKIFNEAAKRVEEIKKGGSLNHDEYESLVKEYGKLLKQLRQSIHFADRISNGLFKNNMILDEKVHFDALTGIYNRRFLDDNIKRIINSLYRGNRLLSVMMLDIDFFKKYNDTYGHSEGDECLKAVAKALSGTGRADDCVIRYGGEEFVILLPNTGKVGAGITAERLLENVRALKIPHLNSDISEYVTISIGATTVKVKHRHRYMNYIERADEALYISKETGRDKYTHLKYHDIFGGCGNEV
jgi:diguanylate cyclase (GGDEF)-like protein